MVSDKPVCFINERFKPQPAKDWARYIIGFNEAYAGSVLSFFDANGLLARENEWYSIDLISSNTIALNRYLPVDRIHRNRSVLLNELWTFLFEDTVQTFTQKKCKNELLTIDIEKENASVVSLLPYADISFECNLSNRIIQVLIEEGYNADNVFSLGIYLHLVFIKCLLKSFQIPAEQIAAFYHTATGRHNNTAIRGKEESSYLEQLERMAGSIWADMHSGYPEWLAPLAKLWEAEIYSRRYAETSFALHSFGFWNYPFRIDRILGLSSQYTAVLYPAIEKTIIN